MLLLFGEIKSYFVQMCFNFCSETLWYPRRDELKWAALHIHDLSVSAAVRDMKEVLAFVASEEAKGSCGAC